MKDINQSVHGPIYVKIIDDALKEAAAAKAARAAEEAAAKAAAAAK